MASYTEGTSAVATARPDLAFAMSRYWEEYLGPQSSYIALRAFRPIEVSGPGQITIPDKTWFCDPDAANISGVRGLGQKFPKANPAADTTYNVTPLDRGQVAWWDDNAPGVLRRKAAGESQDELTTAKSLALCLQAIDRMAAAKLCAGSTPFTAADVSASSAKWSTASTAIRTQFAAGEVLLGRSPNRMALSRKSWAYLKANTAITGTFTGAVAMATISDALMVQLLGDFGIEQVFIGDTDIWTDYVVCWVASGPYNGVILPYIAHDGADERGVCYEAWDEPGTANRVHNRLAAWCGDIVADAAAGFRITDVY